MKRRLVIEVNHSCKECPFANKQQNEVIACWHRDGDRMLAIGSGESIPDWCPLPVVEYDRVLACRLPQDSF